MILNISTVFNVVILVFIAFEILNSTFDARSRVGSIRLPASFLASDRESYENYENTVNAIAQLPDAEPEEPEEDLSLTVAYSEYTNPHRPVSAGPADAAETSYYLEWIRKDLEPWAKTGITEELIEAAAYNWSCMGERMRVNIQGGVLWVEHLSWRPKEGWYPAKLGPGNMSAKGKIPYVIFAILDTLRAYPGQIPDVELAVHTADFPCIHKPPDGRPPPITFASNSGMKFADIVFPDYSYYGHEHSWFWSPDNTYLMGWTVQQQYTAQKWANFSLLDRIPQVMWRGRTYDPEYPDRDGMRRNFVECPVKFREAGQEEAAKLWNIDQGSYMLTDLGDFRYNMYLESEAWVTNLRLKLSCGSVMLSNRMEYHEFFTRALVPGYHYVEVDQNNMCEDALTKLLAMEARLKEHGEPLPKGANYQVEDYWDWHKFEYSPSFMQHLAKVHGGSDGGAAGNETSMALQQRRRLLQDGLEGVPEDPLAAAAMDLSDLSRLDQPPLGAVPKELPDVLENTSSTAEAQVLQQAAPEVVASGAVQTAAELSSSLNALLGTATSGSTSVSDGGDERPQDASAAASQSLQADRVQLTDGPVKAKQDPMLDPALDPDAEPVAVIEDPAELVLKQQLDAAAILPARESRREQPRVQLLETAPVADGAVHKREALEGDFTSKPSGLQPVKLVDGKTPLQQHEARRAEVSKYPWGKVEPWQVAENSGKFVRDHVRMTDIRLYIRDMLREYATLQAFKPQKKRNSVCYTGKLLLEQFGRPHARDEHILRQSYPWLEDFDPGCPNKPEAPPTKRRRQKAGARH